MTDPPASSQMTVDLEGKVALVTGSTRGLGRQMASALARCGADVVISSRKADACEATAKEVANESGRRTMARACHVGRWNDVAGLVDDVYEEMGRIDILVNNAGMSPVYDKLTDIDEALFDKTIGVNLKGPFRLGVLIGTRMAEGDGGTMIHVSSTGSVHPRPAYLPYAAAKAGLNAMSEGLARSFGPSVRSNIVMAGPFETEITAGWDWDAFERKAQEFALRRIGQPHEIVGAVLYFASGASSYTTGTILTVNGGEP